MFFFFFFFFLGGCFFCCQPCSPNSAQVFPRPWGTTSFALSDWSRALSGVPGMCELLPLGPASLAAPHDLLISWMTCGNDHWRWRISFSPSLLSLTFQRSPLHVSGEGHLQQQYHNFQ